MDERIGIIDLGSNTTRLIVVAYCSPHSFHLVDEVSEVVRLAEGMGRDRLLKPQPIRRAIETLKMFHSFCRATGVQRIIAVATSAVREAANQTEFLDIIKRETGLALRVLTGEQEGFYGYLGVANSMTINNGYVIDIGGGSTEVTEIYQRAFSRSTSQPIGIVRLTEQCVFSDPISKQDFRVLEKTVSDTFANLDWFKAMPGHTLVGVGGTVRNLARMDQKRNRYPLDRLHGYILTDKALESIIGLLRVKNLAERVSLPGLNRDRADVILTGAVILRQLMRQANFEELVVSGDGLREGLFFEHFLAHQDTPLIRDVRGFSIHNLGHLYHYEVAHVHKVRELSLSLFDQLRSLHGYGAWEREMLSYSAILHDIGVQVGYYDHHKHSAYLVLNSALHGFTHREVALLALLVRLHRKGTADTREYQSIFSVDDTERVSRLAALLRIAEYLERSKSQVVQRLHVTLGSGIVRVEVEATGDATVEIWAANRRANLFKAAFGCDIEIVERSV